MWQTTQGILLKKTRYADNKYILKIFTANDGVGSFSIQTSDKGKKNIVRALLGQPMAFIEFTYLNKATKEIKPIRDIHSDITFLTIPHDIIRQTISLFMNEMILQTIRLPMHDEQMYQFLRNSLIQLDDKQSNAANFPVWFAVHLAVKLGFGPKKPEHESHKVFDLVTGKFAEPSVIPGVTLTPELSEHLKILISEPTPPDISIPRKDRLTLLNFMLDYFSYHADFDANIKSSEILSMVFQ